MEIRTVPCDLTLAHALNWEIYADAGGVPDGDPWGGGSAPVWSLSLPPTDAQVTLSLGARWLSYPMSPWIWLLLPIWRRALGGWSFTA